MSSQRERQARVAELNNLGRSNLARLVADCSGDDLTDPFATDTCAKRVCPTCGPALVERLCSDLATELATFRERCLTFASVAISQSSLRETWRWTRFRPLSSFYEWLGERAVGVIWADVSGEAPPAIKVALVIDCGVQRARELEHVWRYVAFGRGGLSVVPEAGLSAWTLARKLADPNRWCVHPGSVPLDVLGGLLDAMHGHRWMINWRTSGAWPRKDGRQPHAKAIPGGR
jgi:hypothetical protein